MIEELAIVLATEGDVAEVEPQRRATCDQCGVKGTCGTSLIDRFLGRRPLRLTVENTIGARVGDRVMLGVADAVLLRAALTAYLAPLAGLLLGAVVMLELAGLWRWPNPDGWSMLGGLAGFGLSMRWVAVHSRRLRADPRYRPTLLGKASGGSERGLSVQFSPMAAAASRDETDLSR